MYKRIVQFFMWLFPILRQAAVQVLAEEMHKIAYPNHPYRRPFNYQRFAQRGTRRTAKVDLDEVRDYAEKDVDDTLRTQYDGPLVRRLSDGPATPFDIDWKAGNRVPEIGFHDVLLVAFDLKGRSAYQVHQWLADSMPDSSEVPFDGKSVHLDDWWIANDERFNDDDRDSAVFVKKDFQAEAREKLRAHGLVD